VTDQPIQRAAYWDQTADSYIVSAEPFTARFCRDAVELAGIEPGMTLLDIATGPGALALAAQGAGAQVTAIDFSQAMISRLATRAGSSRLVAKQMDGQSLDLPSDHFDRVCSVFGIPLFPDWRAGLTEMTRVLRPGGRAVLGVAANPYGFGPNHLFAEARRVCLPDQPIDIDLPGMDVLSDADRLSAALLAAGMEDVVLHSRTHDIVLPADVLENDSAMITSNPLIVGLAQGEREKVMEQAKQLASRWRHGDQIRMPSTAHLAVATKVGHP
jgi:SAM-dependent methyltransferase